MPKPPNTIVAEVSKSWSGHQLADASLADFISTKFELVIETNNKRGYRLKDWRYGMVTYPSDDGIPVVTETIVAVFARRGSFADAESDDE